VIELSLLFLAEVHRYDFAGAAPGHVECVTSSSTTRVKHALASKGRRIEAFKVPTKIRFVIRQHLVKLLPFVTKAFGRIVLSKDCIVPILAELELRTETFCVNPKELRMHIPEHALQRRRQ
jgi:hypothetical protein